MELLSLAPSFQVKETTLPGDAGRAGRRLTWAQRKEEGVVGRSFVGAVVVVAAVAVAFVMVALSVALNG
jgi:hypothetical protein